MIHSWICLPEGMQFGLELVPGLKGHSPTLSPLDSISGYWLSSLSKQQSGLFIVLGSLVWFQRTFCRRGTTVLHFHHITSHSVPIFFRTFHEFTSLTAGGWLEKWKWYPRSCKPDQCLPQLEKASWEKLGSSPSLFVIAPGSGSQKCCNLASASANALS